MSATSVQYNWKNAIKTLDCIKEAYRTMKYHHIKKQHLIKAAKSIIEEVGGEAATIILDSGYKTNIIGENISKSDLCKVFELYSIMYGSYEHETKIMKLSEYFNKENSLKIISNSIAADHYMNKQCPLQNNKFTDVIIKYGNFMQLSECHNQDKSSLELYDYETALKMINSIADDSNIDDL